MPRDFNPSDRKAVAREIVWMRYPGVAPDTDIRTTIDELFERMLLVDFYNVEVAKWLRGRTIWDWITMAAADLDDVETLRDFGRVCYAHLRPRQVPELVEDVDIMEEE